MTTEDDNEAFKEFLKLPPEARKQPSHVYCCHGGFVFARCNEFNNLYAFLCTCGYGQNKSFMKLPTWVNSYRYTKEA